MALDDTLSYTLINGLSNLKLCINQLSILITLKPEPSASTCGPELRLALAKRTILPKSLTGALINFVKIDHFLINLLVLPRRNAKFSPNLINF